MSALDKARLAMSDAAALDVDLAEKVLPPKFHNLIRVASVQADIAQAEALTEMVGLLRDLRELLVAAERSTT